MKKKRKAKTIVRLHLLALPTTWLGSKAFSTLATKSAITFCRRLTRKTRLLLSEPKQPFFLSLFLGRKSNHAIRNDSWADQGGGGKLDNPHASQWTVHDLHGSLPQPIDRERERDRERARKKGTEKAEMWFNLLLRTLKGVPLRSPVRFTATHQ